MILDHLPERINQLNLSFIASLLCLALIFLFLTRRSRKVFLLDFACYKPPATQMCSKEKFIDRFRIYGSSNESSLDFMRKCLVRSGLGEKTYMPSTLMRDPPTLSLEETRKEVESVMFGAVDALLEKTGVNPKDIGIVIATCTILNVEPSLADMIVNKYKLGDHVLVYNFTSMGCSAGLRAIGLAQGLLQVGSKLQISLSLSPLFLFSSSFAFNFRQTSVNIVLVVVAWSKKSGFRFDFEKRVRNQRFS
jgi:3-ketoacyl-CoA synthase